MNLEDLVLNIYSEFSRLEQVLVHTGCNAIDISIETYRNLIPPEMLLKHPETRAVRRDSVMANVAELHLLLKRKGVKLVYPSTVDDVVCQVFTRDPSFVVGGTLYLASMKDDYRLPERSGLQELCESTECSPIAFKQGEAKIEGGDVMVMSPSLALIGIGQASNAAGAAALREYLVGDGFEQVVAVTHDALHLDCCLAPLPGGQALIVGDQLPRASQDLIRPFFKDLIELDRDEAAVHLAANLLWLNPQEVVSNSMAPKTNQLLSSLGYKVHALDFSGVTPMWGGARCVTSPLRRAMES